MLLRRYHSPKIEPKPPKKVEVKEKPKKTKVKE